MGATGCTRKGEPIESQGSLTLTLNARALDAVAARIVEAWPDDFRGATSVREVAAELRGEVDQGHDVAAIEAACRAYAGKPKAWGASGWPMAAHKLIASGRWESHVPKAAGPKAATRTGFADAEVRRRLIGVMGEDWVAAWLDPCGWDAGKRVIDPRLKLRAKRLGEARPGEVLADMGVTVGKVG